ncbi:hypothetical protein LPJ61_002710 [Coemansia biformis]|uniref:Uncharacterized protein n=1 Tax=Coemansia biformis TaxID=1286918 RepID=A0A9W8CWY6_9FUNG|nr:hypothetical protein LPJ61_002710 [Coemansia biformis]
MRRRPHVVLDDFFVKEDLLSAILGPGCTGGDTAWAARGGYFEIPSGNPVASQLLSSTHTALQRWVRASDVQVMYSGWLYNAHLAIIAAVAARYVAGLAAAPVAESLGALSSICLLLVLSYHIAFFAALNYRPAWFEHVVIFHSPFAWAAIWLQVFAGDGQESGGVAMGPAIADGPARSQLDRHVGPLALLLMHCFIWYTRRTVIGVAVFERRIRASPNAHWTHRIYSVLAGLAIVLAWRAYPYASACWRLCWDAAHSGVGERRASLREWADERGTVGLLRLGTAMLVSGGTHALWYSFISYAYHLVVWKDYLREGLAVWVIGDSAMCTKLY